MILLSCGEKASASFFFFSSRRRHTRWPRDWSSDVCSSDLDVHRSRLLLLLIASLVTGAAVAVSGIISFVGLVVPHAVRLLIGAKHALLLPLSIAGGALFLVIADTIARASSVNVVVQTGAVCAVIGAPVFLALLLSRRSA